LDTLSYVAMLLGTCKRVIYSQRRDVKGELMCTRPLGFCGLGFMQFSVTERVGF